MTRQQTVQALLAAQDTAYQAFQSKLVPGQDNILGVRMPAVRRIAGQIARADFRAWLDDPAPDRWYEETMLRGIVIATATMVPEERFARTAEFVPQIDNWAVCDCVCGSFDLTDRVAWWGFIQPYLHTEDEFAARFGAVMLLHLFAGADDLTRTLSALCGIPAKGYNARMGVAWALSVCGVRFPAETLAFLSQAGLDDWTHNKTLQKMLESRRLAETWRPHVKACKRRRENRHGTIGT